MLAQVTYETSSDGSSTGVLIAVYGVLLVLGIIHLIGFWKTLEKGGEPGAWSLLLLTGCFAPVAYVPMARLSGRPTWWVVLLYIPIVNFVVLAILSIDIAKSYGRSTGYGVGLWLLSFIFYPMLGFGPATYQGPAGPQAPARV
jgi:hypothetical protein